MTTQTTKVNLTIDGIDVKVGHELLEDIVRYMPDTKENAKVFEKLDMVGFDSDRVAKLFPFELSGGMRKRAATARAIILEPKIILYDEPTSGLDPIISDLISQMTMMLQRKLGVTSIVISHDLSVTLEYANRAAYLNQSLIMHENIKAYETKEDHFCEIELLNTLSEVVSEHKCPSC